MTGQAISRDWADSLERYEVHAGGRISPTTLRVRMGLLHKLAGDLGGAPASVQPEDFAQWLAGLTCSRASTGNYVLAARAFYGWAVRAGVAEESPVPVATPVAERHRVYTLDARWADAVAGFERAEVAAHRATATMRRRLQQVRRFAATIGIGPWHVQADDYGAWLARQDVSDSRRASMRDALRAFYGWAVRAGRVGEDPTATLDRRAIQLGVPPAWDAEIRAWRRMLIGSGAASTTVRTRTEHLEQFARAHRSADPYALTTDDVFDYMAGHRWARETRRGHRVTIRAFYRWAVASGRTAEDPTALMPRVKAGDPSRTPATDAEYQAALSATTDERFRLGLRLACELGMRRGEVAQAHASDMRDDANGAPWLTVHGKGGKVRRLPVPDNLAAAIRRAGDGYLLPSVGGGHLTPRYIGKRVSRLLPPGVTMHALRHAFATRTYNVNRDVFAVQRLLGHASAATTQRYVQVGDDSLRALVEAAAR
ncbi:tyrosine-type recombinase/integrase [Microbacterium sp.]|uniref:tyrosine-type recombinase/integrase n=1 Tax=Microbacterium sp. TaxID=51671 RepID=UPI003C71BC70